MNRQKVLETAETLYFRHGFHKTSMDRLVKEIRISKATLYEIVPTKQDLLALLVKRSLQRLDQHLGKTFRENHRSVTDKLTRIAWQRSQYLSLMGLPFRYDLEHHEPELFEHLVGGENLIHERYISKLITTGRQQGLFRKDVKKDFLLGLFLELSAMTANETTTARLGYEGETFYKKLFSVFFQGAIAETYKAEQLDLFG